MSAITARLTRNQILILKQAAMRIGGIVFSYGNSDDGVTLGEMGLITFVPKETDPEQRAYMERQRIDQVTVAALALEVGNWQKAGSALRQAQGIQDRLDAKWSVITEAGREVAAEL